MISLVSGSLFILLREYWATSWPATITSNAEQVLMFNPGIEKDETSLMMSMLNINIPLPSGVVASFQFNVKGLIRFFSSPVELTA